MTDIVQAWEVIRTRLEQNKPAALTAGFRWPNETGDPLPDKPEPFAYVEFITEPGACIGVGGGRGNNLYRNPGEIHLYVFVPRNKGAKAAMSAAEALAALFRSYRDDDISCHAASVLPGGDGNVYRPPGLRSEVGNYFFSFALVELTYDQIG